MYLHCQNYGWLQRRKSIILANLLNKMKLLCPQSWPDYKTLLHIFIDPTQGMQNKQKIPNYKLPTYKYLNTYKYLHARTIAATIINIFTRYTHSYPKLNYGEGLFREGIKHKIGNVSVPGNFMKEIYRRRRKLFIWLGSSCLSQN